MTRSVIGMGLLGLCLVLVTPHRSQAGIPVTEDGPNLQANIFGGFQQFLNTLEAVFHSTQWTLDLTGYGDHGLDGLEENMEELVALIDETQGLLFDIRSLEAQTVRLFGVADAPDSTEGLRKRLAEVRSYRQARITQAQRMQTLQRTALRVVERIVRMVGRILSIAGDKQGLQQLQSQLSNLNHQTTQTGTLIAAYQQVELDEPQEQIMVQESMTRIHEALTIGWPGSN